MRCTPAWPERKRRRRGSNSCASPSEGAKTAGHSAREKRRGAWRRATQKPEIEYRDRPGSHDAADRRDCRRKARHSRRGGVALWQIQGQDRARLRPLAARPAERQADPRHRDHADPGWRGQDDDDGRARRRAEPDRQKGDAVPARGEPWPVLWRQRRCSRRRLRPGRADGGHQPPLHRRHPCDRRRQQSARGDGRQPCLLRARSAHRPAPGQLAAGNRHERPGSAFAGFLARRRGQRLPARGRVRHHRRLAGDGNVLPGDQPAGLAAPARQHRRRPDARAQTGDGRRGQGGGVDDRATEGRARPQPGADNRTQPGFYPWRPVRQHRAWLQLGDRDHVGTEACRLRGHRGGLWRRSRGREILRHQMPQSRDRARRSGRSNDSSGAQDAWRRRP